MTRPRILVTDARERSVLAAIRCLAASGYEVTATAAGRVSPGLWSRGCASRALIPPAISDPRGFVGGLVEIVRSRPHAVLIPGTDASLYAISKDRLRLEADVRLGLPEHSVVETCLNRAAFADRAAEVGLAPPAQRVCETFDDALEAARDFGWPLFVKAVRTVTERDGTLVRHPSDPARDEASLLAAQRRMGACIVQRPVTGSVLSFGGVATDGGLLASVVSRYVRTWPVSAGNACFSETIASPPGLTAAIEALTMALGWRGVFEIELIRQPGGALHAIDFNPRPYGSMTLGTAAGAPLSSLWSRWLLGERPRPVTARPGFRYRWEDGDIRHSLWQASHLAPRQSLAALVPGTRVTHAFGRADDPLPLAARALQLLALGRC